MLTVRFMLSALPRSTRRLFALLACAVVMFVAATPVSAKQATSAGAQAGDWPWPVLGAVITPYRNGSDRYAAGQHRGIDIAAPVGEPVLAIVDGQVSFSGKLPDGGLAVTVRSADRRWLISGLHLSRLSIARGAHVRKGQQLGLVGTSGRRSTTDPHLHLSVRRAANRAYVDPLTLLGAAHLPARESSTGPTVEALERAPGKAKSVRAQATGGEAPATRHEAGSRRPASTSFAGEHAHEGHAAEGISRVAPPPIAAPRELSTPDLQPREMQPAIKPSATVRRSDSRSPRLVLIAVAAICLIALALRRQPPPAEPTNAPEATEVLADVIELEPDRRSA